MDIGFMSEVWCIGKDGEMHRHKFLNWIYAAAFFSTLLGQRLFFRVGTSILPVYFFFVVLAFIYVVFRLALPMKKLFFAIYILLSVLTLYVLAGVMDAGNILFSAQLFPYLLTPIVFVSMGYYADDALTTKFMLIASVLSALLSIIQYMAFSFSIAGPFSLFKLITQYDSTLQLQVLGYNIYSRATGFFLDANVLGLLSGSIFFYFCTVTGKCRRRTQVIGALSALVGLALSTSRGSAVALFAGMTVLFTLFVTKSIVTRKIGITYVKIFLVFVVVLFCLIPFVRLSDFDRFAEILNVLDSGVSASVNLQGRTTAWSHIVNYAMNNPFGTIVPPQKIITDSPDNQFVYFLAQGGFLPVGVFLFFFGYAFVFGIRRWFRGGGLLVAIMAYFFVNNITIVAFNSVGSYVIWLSIGSVVSNILPVSGRRWDATIERRGGPIYEG